MQINDTVYAFSRHAKQRILERMLEQFPYNAIDLSDGGLICLAVTDALPGVRFVWRKADYFHGYRCVTVIVDDKVAIDPYEHFNDENFVNSVFDYLDNICRSDLYKIGPTVIRKFKVNQAEASILVRYYLGEFYCV